MEINVVIKSAKNTLLYTIAFVLALPVAYFVFSPNQFAHAATSGKTTLYLKKEPSDINATYNALTLNNSETQADTASATTSTTNVNVAGGPTSFCESSGNSGETFTQISAASTSTGERCIGTFISLPVGQSFSMSTSDSASITANVYSSESTSQVTSSPNIYIYRWSGSGTTVSSGDLVAKFTTCADPGTTPSVCTAAQTAVAPANNISFVATDRIVVIISQTITRSRSSTYVSNYIDNSTRSPSSSISLGYQFTTPNAPSLSGTSDDFTVSQTNTTCSTSTYNTNWACDGPAASGATAEIQSADTSGSGGDNTSFLTLRNKCTGCTVSNFGTTPSNAFIYQTLPSGYGDGSVQTVVNSALSYTIGASTPVAPWNHVGLVLWTSNTDYLELQLYATGVKSSTNTVHVAVNNSGVLGTATNINTSTTTGTYGRIWLEFTKSGTGYQAEYSTDGSTWSNVGTSITHATAFNEVGLNAFSDINNANYSGAFDWFNYDFAPPGPSVDQILRGGEWFSGGGKQPFFWAG